MLMAKRKKRQLTQKDLGELIGVTPQTVSEWERGSRVPSLSPQQTQVFCQAIQVSLDELVELFEEQ